MKEKSSRNLKTIRSIVAEDRFSVYVRFCLSFLSVFLCLCLICLSVSLFSVCLSVSVFVCSVYLSVWLSVSGSALFATLFLFFFVCSVCLLFCLSVSPTHQQTNHIEFFYQTTSSTTTSTTSPSPRQLPWTPVRMATGYTCHLAHDEQPRAGR